MATGILHATHEWAHMIRIFLSISFSIWSFVMKAGFPSLKSLDTISSCVCVCTSHPVIHWLCSGHFGVLHTLPSWITMERVGNTYFISFRCIRRCGMSGSCARSVFHFWRRFILFSIMAALICIPTNYMQAFPFLYSLPSMLYFVLFIPGMLIGVK